MRRMLRMLITDSLEMPSYIGFTYIKVSFYEYTLVGLS